MHKKILIDYDEYNRLTRAADLCEELLKNKEGKGSLSQIIANKEKEDALKPPLPEQIGSITTPANATLNIPKLPKEGHHKSTTHPNKQPRTELHIEDQWFYIGTPQKE